ncbi:hypothetical protein ACFYUY_17380 [Kitasatospora sp. NPDC004745]|uniref:hypothetical protein n=1 Tax=unclassified Kitasatospora TaxID=2633591 RepID=UPI0033D6070A
MRTGKTLATLSLALPLALPIAATAPDAVAAETTVVVTGGQSAPGGWSTATCPARSHLTGGGYTLTPADPADAVLVSAPVPDAPATWAARAARGVVRAYALCETED